MVPNKSEPFDMGFFKVVFLVSLAWYAIEAAPWQQEEQPDGEIEVKTFILKSKAFSTSHFPGTAG